MYDLGNIRLGTGVVHDEPFVSTNRESIHRGGKGSAWTWLWTSFGLNATGRLIKNNMRAEGDEGVKTCEVDLNQFCCLAWSVCKTVHFMAAKYLRQV